MKFKFSATYSTQNVRDRVEIIEIPDCELKGLDEDGLDKIITDYFVKWVLTSGFYGDYLEFRGGGKIGFDWEVVDDE
ncbi:hypothetical protein [Paenibacillus alvei]|uniref:DUF7167 family protein n=1 Tax=Paenibacillus alvei TaxID=44250 RepID=UPI00227EA4E9|nr:hypothetical protein [Paenibacillus alvei]MCY7487922.1 hypothetical protein [Paenibacillus alvei]